MYEMAKIGEGFNLQALVCYDIKEYTKKYFIYIRIFIKNNANIKDNHL
jgi:hypothetical protein